MGGALAEANAVAAASYGDDDYTARAADLFREVFETDCDVYFVFNGTAAKLLALASMCQSCHSVITHEVAHIEVDKCGAPQSFFNGVKLLTVPGEKRQTGSVGSRARGHAPDHQARPPGWPAAS